ncbi:MAG: FtsQ-type POTRA domain-containing protein [Rhodobiaceae bacterium]|nr:cell division protein FtsQ/DivIB [Rhodobiaceae bacterium]MCC0055679.1 FtsQ-type POTRA domain-containing protein [Rhodobiaceae bacterium]
MRTIGTLLGFDDAARKGSGDARRTIFSAGRKRGRQLSYWRDRAELLASRWPRRGGVMLAAGFLALTGLYGGYLGHGMSGMALEGVETADHAVATAGLKISSIRISGHRMLGEETIVDTLWLPLNGSLLFFNAGAARERLLAIPLVADASVQKLYPDTLAVTITERTPYARWQHDGERVMIDREGVPIGGDADRLAGNLPLVVGKGAAEHAGDLLEKLAAYPAISVRLFAAIRVADRRWNLKLDNGVDIKLPEKNFGEALALLDQLDNRDGLMQRDVLAVDFRLPDRVTVSLSDAVSKEVREEVRKRVGGKA